MKKFAVFLISIILLSAGLFVASGIFLERASEEAIDFITRNIRVPNLEYTRPTFSSAGFSSSSFPGITWKGVEFTARMMRNEATKAVDEVAVYIGEITVSLENPASQVILLNVKNVGSTSTVSNISGTGDRMDSSDFKVRIRLKSFNAADVQKEIQYLAAELNQFSTLGVTKLPISFAATETFQIRGKPAVGKLFVEQKGDEYRLVMDKNDLKKIAAMLPGQQPNPVDLEVIARNPVKAPQLLRLRDKAATAAALARQANAKVSEDAYRHTLWSYLLTKTYGEEFAKVVTDAHEAFADEEELKKVGIENFNIASYQDLNNNAVGRRYAKAGYLESSILERVMTDRAIIRDDEMKARFDALAYEKLKPVNFKLE
jgi:hypothetical protein